MIKYLLPRNYLSISQINMYLTCGLSYYFRYIEARPSKPSTPPLLIGSGGHEALEMFNTRWVNDNKVPDFDYLAESFKLQLKKQVKDQNPDAPNAILNTMRDGTIAALKQAYDQFLIHHKPLPNGIEREIRLDVGGVPMLGFIDLISETGMVIDYKIGKRLKQEKDAINSLQLALYSLASGMPKTGLLGLAHAAKQKKAKLASAVKTHADYSWLESIVKFVATGITKGVFMPADPTSWKCNPKYCDFYEDCRGACKKTSLIVEDIIDTTDMEDVFDDKDGVVVNQQSTPNNKTEKKEEQPIQATESDNLLDELVAEYESS